MVSEKPEGLEIRLPPGRNDCIAGGQGRRGGTSTATDWNRSLEPCARCKNGTFGDDGTFEFPNPRAIPIRDNRAVGPIRNWFELYDRLPETGQLNKYISNLGARAGIPRLNSACLRQSFGVLLAGKGFNAYEIGEVLGIDDSTVSGGYMFQTYGEMCEGDNPFACGVETSKGSDHDKCENTVLSPEHDRCWAHRGPYCGAENARGERCERNPTKPDGRCYVHTESE
jgi:hypothetical protein